jgi:DNA primase
MDLVETIKRQIDPVEFIGCDGATEVRALQRPCPSTEDSFFVFPSRTWRCWHCGEGGDIFTFVQKRENTDFRGALRALAAEAGVELVAEDPRKRSHTERLAATMSAAVEYFQRCLREPGGAEAIHYLTEKRGLEMRTIETWRLGWAPDEWRGLRDFLRNRGYEDRDMIGAGLLVEGENGREPYDRFRGRAIIPIANERGEFVAMGGRGLNGEEPKYLNSPQTELFDKGRTLFGLNIAASSIRESGWRSWSKAIWTSWACAATNVTHHGHLSLRITRHSSAGTPGASSWPWTRMPPGSPPPNAPAASSWAWNRPSAWPRLPALPTPW